MIPEYVLKQISEQAEKFGSLYTNDLAEKLKIKGSYSQGAEFGYSLAEEEIERLKGLIKEGRHCGNPDCDSCNSTWQQFKSENQL